MQRFFVLHIDIQDVDQSTGEDLNPGGGVRLPASDKDEAALRNPDR